MCISKRIKWILKKSHREKFFFLIFLQSIHQVDIKNVVKLASDFFPYFEALYTNSDLYMIILISFDLFLGHDSIVELMEAVDTNVPDPDRNLETPFFLPVEATHSIPGR